MWGPSGKVVEVGGCNAARISEHVWWLLRTTGTRSSKWGNNVDRHVVARPSVQGMWTPASAAQRVTLTSEVVDAGGALAAS